MRHTAGPPRGRRRPATQHDERDGGGDEGQRRGEEELPINGSLKARAGHEQVAAAEQAKVVGRNDVAQHVDAG